MGSKDITVGDIAAKVNDGKYHVVRFSRSGANSTLQIDDNTPQEHFPLGEDILLKILQLQSFNQLCAIVFSGNRHLTTVFNDQAEIQGLKLMPTAATITFKFPLLSNSPSGETLHQSFLTKVNPVDGDTERMHARRLAGS